MEKSNFRVRVMKYAHQLAKQQNTRGKSVLLRHGSYTDLLKYEKGYCEICIPES